MSYCRFYDQLTCRFVIARNEKPYGCALQWWYVSVSERGYQPFRIFQQGQTIENGSTNKVCI